MTLLKDKKFLASLTIAFAIVGTTWLAVSAMPLHDGEEVRIQPSFAFDPADDVELALHTHHIFVGRVIAADGIHWRAGGSTPWSRFQVEVTDNVMGQLPQQVTVLQEGGFSVEDGRMMLVEGDELLEVGRTYLLATRTGGDGAWHTLVPIYGKLQVDDSRERQRLIERFGTVAEMIEREERAIERERQK